MPAMTIKAAKFAAAGSFQSKICHAETGIGVGDVFGRKTSVNQAAITVNRPCTQI